MQTAIKGKWKFKSDSDRLEFEKYERQYTSSVHIFYRYLCRQTKNNTKLESKEFYYRKDSPMLKYFMQMNNIELIQSVEWFRHCAFYDAYELIKTRGRHVVFGGKHDYMDYLKGLMTYEDYIEQKLRPFYCIGTAKPYKGN